MNESIQELIELLGLTTDDVLKALLTTFSPCQPGALKQAWNNRKNYGPSPSPSDIWEIYKKYDFRCCQCKSQYRIAIDHIDNDSLNSELDNFQLLCQSCNRAKQKRGVKNKDTNLRAYKSFMELIKKNNTIPKPGRVTQYIGMGSAGGAGLSLLKFLSHRMKQRHPELEIDRHNTKVRFNTPKT